MTRAETTSGRAESRSLLSVSAALLGTAHPGTNRARCRATRRWKPPTQPPLTWTHIDHLVSFTAILTHIQPYALLHASNSAIRAHRPSFHIILLLRQAQTCQHTPHIHVYFTAVPHSCCREKSFLCFYTFLSIFLNYMSRHIWSWISQYMDKVTAYGK